jgi:class 3 adenylate cyclase/tetratricopeptide (TPR) repeat protein
VLICSSCGIENPDGAKFCNECATPLGASATSPAFRRIVTALFCDLVGSTTLAEQHDPEVLRPILDGYFTEMRSAVERHGGRVEKFIGDAVVAIFGLPVAHEDDALRAVRTGMEMQERMQTLNGASPIPLAARIGITTGEVLVPGDGNPIIGDAMNTASRLQSGASPGSMLIGETTWRLVRDAVVAEAVEPLNAKGKAEPVPAWRVLEVHPAAARIETPLVGRDRPLRVLNEALEDAIDDQACVLVTVLASPGVGKSRLATAFANAVRERAMVLVGQTPSYGEGVTFAPLVELLSQAAGRPDGDAESVAAALRERLVTQPDGPAVGDRIAQILGVGEALGSDASWAVRRLLEVLAAEQPLVVVLEDVHWAEPPMLDLADSVIERVHGPVLFLCLARPELFEQRPTWAAGKPRAITTTLPPLSPEDARRVAELLLGPQAPAPVVDRVCQTAEGNPLYLEQLTAMLADQGLLVDGRWAGSEDADVEIPATLQALLAARLDRLDSTPRLVLERASVEGRRFRIAALRALVPDLGPEDVESAIASLERRGLVQPEDEAGGRWRFAHALVLEAAYRGLPKELRADLHEGLADWMIEEDADQSDVDESVARHLERALHLREELGARDERSVVLSERTGELFATAGLRAFAALDYITSRDLLGRAAALLPERSLRRFDLIPNLGAALADSGRTEEAEALLSEAVDQARAAGSERDALRATVQLLSNRVYRSPTDAEIESAVVEARSAADAFEVLDDDVGLTEAAVANSYLEEARGRVAEAHEWTTRALRHALAAGRPREATQAAGDLFGLSTFGPLPFDRFAAIARGLLSTGEPLSGSAGHALMAVAALATGDDPGFNEHEGRWRDVLDRHGLAWLTAAHGLWIASVEISVGRAEAAERRLREAREFLAPLGYMWWVGLIDVSLCQAVGAQDRPREFLRLADAFEASVLLTDRGTLIRRQLVLARARLLRGSAVEAEAAARRALKLLGPTDLVPEHANALLMLSEILDARGLGDDAAVARSEAIAKLRAKGNLAAVARIGG